MVQFVEVDDVYGIARAIRINLKFEVTGRWRCVRGAEVQVDEEAFGVDCTWQAPWVMTQATSGGSHSRAVSDTAFAEVDLHTWFQCPFLPHPWQVAFAAGQSGDWCVVFGHTIGS